MIPLLQTAGSLDQGSFALLTSALAMYRPTGPDWIVPLLRRELEKATPAQLRQAAAMLRGLDRDLPEHRHLKTTLIHVLLLQDQPGPALEVARRLARLLPRQLRYQRLWFETALCRPDLDEARRARHRFASNKREPMQSTLDQVRLSILEGRTGAPIDTLQSLIQTAPDRPELYYFLGLARLVRFELSEPSAHLLLDAIENLQRAALMTPSNALRRRASKCLAHARALMSAVRQRPELFPGQPTGTTTP